MPAVWGLRDRDGASLSVTCTVDRPEQSGVSLAYGDDIDQLTTPTVSTVSTELNTADPGYAWRMQLTGAMAHLGWPYDKWAAVIHGEQALPLTSIQVWFDASQVTATVSHLGRGVVIIRPPDGEWNRCSILDRWPAGEPVDYRLTDQTARYASAIEESLARMANRPLPPDWPPRRH